MKISIGINGFKQYKDLEQREKFCLESLKVCKQKYNQNNISLYLVKNLKDDINYEGFETLNIKHATKYPFVNTILNALAQTDCDIFVFLNNDIILNTNFFKHIDNKYETYAASRGHLHELNSLNEPLNIEGYSVHGFDLFAFKKEWWQKNKSIFPDMYLGRSYWDTVYFTKCATKSNILVLNKLPPVIYHVEHQSTAAHDKDEYNTHNENVLKAYPDMNKWWYYVYNVLLKRPTVNNIKWWQPLENELQLEQAVFKNEN